MCKHTPLFIYYSTSQSLSSFSAHAQAKSVASSPLSTCAAASSASRKSGSRTPSLCCAPAPSACAVALGGTRASHPSTLLLRKRACSACRRVEVGRNAIGGIVVWHRGWTEGAGSLHVCLCVCACAYECVHACVCVCARVSTGRLAGWQWAQVSERKSC